MDFFLAMVLSVLVGVVVGMFSGMLGVGGGTMLVPVFRLGFGMSAIASTATSLFTIIPTSLTGVIAHVRNKTCIPKLGIAAGLGGAATSPLGVWLASVSPEWAIVLAAALVIGYSAVTMFRKANMLRRKQNASSLATSGAAVARSVVPSETLDQFQARVSTGRQLLVGAAVGVGAGVVSGYVGVGGGFIMVPMFMHLLDTPMKLTSGTSLIAVMILAIPGTITHGMMGNVDWTLGLLIAIGTVPGAAIGAKLMTRISELALRFGFAAFLLVAAALLLVNQLGVF